MAGAAVRRGPGGPPRVPSGAGRDTRGDIHAHAVRLPMDAYRDGFTGATTVSKEWDPMSNEIAVRPFSVNVPEEDLVDLRRRVAATRWPDRETVTDQSQGVQLAKIQEVVRYWGTDHDCRKAEAKLNAVPLLMTHGWPGSIFELLKVIGPLTDPTAHGGRAEDAFDLVLPSLPGYGFSARPQDTGWGPIRMGSAWHELMGRLGYQRYVAQGGDWARSS